MEFVLGITDVEPRLWKNQEPLWDDEQLIATSKDSFLQLATEVCNHSIHKRRPNDYHVHAHVWNWKVSSLQHHLKTAQGRGLGRMHDDSSNPSRSEDQDSDNEDAYRGGHLVAPREQLNMYRQDLEEDEYQLLDAARETLSTALLPQGHILHFTYDMGSTTHLYCKVVSVRPLVAGTILRHLGPADSTAQVQRMEALAAYSLAKEDQIDSFYPNFAKAFLSKQVGSITWGLCSKIRSEQDTVWCSMENATCSSDVFFASRPFTDMHEFLQLAEEAWTPTEQTKRYNPNFLSRHVFPSDATGDASFEHMTERNNHENAQFGPKLLLFRKQPLDESVDETKKTPSFDFRKTFPKTYAHFTSGKFRWIKYKNGMLRVLVGRATGHDHREFSSNQVLVTWRRTFCTLHELLCAVEASWVYGNYPLGADTILAGIDADVGPSHPLPPEPTVLGRKQDAVVVSQCNDPNQKIITVMEMVQEKDGKMVLYCGHVNGMLNKWCLKTSQLLWSKQVFEDCADDFEHFSDYIGVRLGATGGVAGLVIRQQDDGKHLLYVWTHAIDDDDPYPSVVHCLNGSNGSLVTTYTCHVGQDRKGRVAVPSIATVVVAPLWNKDEKAWMDTLVVGLHCSPAGLIQWNQDYSDFDLDAAQACGEGNILPFDLSTGKPLETWRAHSGIIRAMAVMLQDKYLLSYSMRHGHGLPDAMVLWDLQHPGVPLSRFDFWDPSASLRKQQQYRLDDISGISISGPCVLFLDDSADRIAAVKVNQNRRGGKVSLSMEGYARVGARYSEEEDFHGSMALSGGKVALSNEVDHNCWLFDIESVCSDARLDKRDGNRQLLLDERRGDDDDNRQQLAQQLALGKVEFPPFAGCPPKRKKRRLGAFGNDDKSVESNEVPDDDMGIWLTDTNDGQGNGGPVAYAMYGKWLVAGYLNGSIVRAPLLPDEFNVPPETIGGTNGVVSCSRLPSDEWFCPVLEAHVDRRRRRRKRRKR